MFDQELPVSYYEEISQLNKEHHVSVVRHRETGRICVKKVLSVYDLDVYAALFRRPVRQVPRIYALYENAGTLTVIEEYIPGDSLEEVLALTGPLPEDDAVRIAADLCRILAELHACDPPVIHRDVKPSNILLTEDGEVVLLDLNAARFMRAGKASDTVKLGTPGFAAPEQYGFGSSTTATDLYAVGVLLDLMLTGEPGRTAENVSPALRDLIRHCRALDPAYRLSDAAELARALSALPVKDPSRPPFRLKSCPVCGKRLPAGAPSCPDCGQAFEAAEASSASSGNDGSVPENSVPAGSSSGSSVKSRRRMPVKAGFSCLAALLLLAAAFLIPFRSRKPGPDVPVPPGITGSYQGEGGSGLTILADGTAIYYHEEEVYSEPMDPWTYRDGRLSITLSKLHCVITADVRDDDFSRLVFRSESGNWDAETFVKLPEEDPAYLESALRSPDRAVTVLPSGEMSLIFDGIRFTVPKHYVVRPDASGNGPDTAVFTDTDTDTVYYGGLLFHNAGFEYLDTLDARLNFSGFAKEFLYSFYYDVRLTDVKEETIAGTRAFTARFTGETNRGFIGATGLYLEGIVAFLCNDADGRVLRVCFAQTSDNKTDRMQEMEDILYGAVRVSE